ncbi:MAG: phosphoenolpyruvate-utilizing N-terminal domain-containing protein, partial [Chloroflexota bacterium]
MNRLQGVAAAPGLVRGPWVRIEQVAVSAGGSIAPGMAAAEISHLSDAVEAAAKELEAIAQRVEADGHPEEAAIFLAQAAIARDPALASMASARIQES